MKLEFTSNGEVIAAREAIAVPTTVDEQHPDGIEQIAVYDKTAFDIPGGSDRLIEFAEYHINDSQEDEKEYQFSEGKQGYRLIREPFEDSTIYTQFELTFCRPPKDATLRNLWTSDPCGEDCDRIIEVGKALIELCDPITHTALVDAIEHAIEIYWRG